MRQYYLDNKEFGHHLTRFNTIMLRSSTLTDEQKEEMKEVLKVIYKYDQFIDENPDVQERVQRSRVEALAEGGILTLRRLAITAVKKRFPSLLAQAQSRIEQIQDTNTLDELILQLASATTEDEARKLLNIKKASRRRKQ
jgi:hypothetical protein